MSQHWIPDGNGGFILKTDSLGWAGLWGIALLGGLLLISPFLIGAGFTFLTFSLITGVPTTASPALGLSFHIIAGITYFISSCFLYVKYFSEMTSSVKIMSLLAILLLVISPVMSFNFLFPTETNIFGSKAPIVITDLGQSNSEFYLSRKDFVIAHEYSVSNLGQEDILITFGSLSAQINCSSDESLSLKPGDEQVFICVIAHRSSSNSNWTKQNACIYPVGYRRNCSNNDWK